MQVAAIIGGFGLLVWGADRFVIGAAASARNLGVSPLLIGLTIVGFGTSAPEMLVSGMAAWSGNAGLGIGNAVGSNIANVGLILGLTALLVPLQVHSVTLRRELPMLLITALAALALLLDGSLDRVDGLVLMGGLVAMLAWVVHLGLSARRGVDPMAAEFAAEIPADLSTGQALFWLLAGILVLLFASRLLVWGAVGVATWLGVSDLVIGLTIVALGTSLPELAASIASARKGEHDIAIGNVIGSNMFNLLAVLGMPALIQPGPVERAVLTRDFPVMIGLTLGLMLMARGFHQAGHISRLEGLVLVAVYCAYQTLLYFAVRN